MSSNLAGCANGFNDLDKPVPASNLAASAQCPRNLFSAGSPAAAIYPIVVAEWQRNDREIVRVALDQYNGVETVDARAWWRDDNGNWHPGRGGLTLSLKHLPALAEGLADALDRARALGLVEPVTGTKSKDKTAGRTAAAIPRASP